MSYIVLDECVSVFAFKFSVVNNQKSEFGLAFSAIFKRGNKLLIGHFSTVAMLTMNSMVDYNYKLSLVNYDSIAC